MSEIMTPEWCERRKETQELSGADMVLDKATGYLQNKRGIGFTAAMKQSFIGSLNQAWNLSKAIKKAGISSSKVVYDHLALDPLFREHYAEALERHVDDAEEFLIDNAKNNQKATAERIFLLKKRRSKVYGDSIELKGGTADESFVKELVSKMGKYTAIPSESVITVKNETES
jgi:hypothetical protein